MILGWREWVALPDLGVGAVHAKLDTGARTSALHVVEIDIYRRAGRKWVRFQVDPDPKRPNRVIETAAPLIDERVVKSSSGVGELRAVIETRIAVGGREWPIEVSLTSRDEMRFRMLIGRAALAGRVVIDPKRSNVAGKPPRSRRKVVK